MGVMKMGNTMPRAGIDPTSMTFRDSVLPLHNIGFPDVTTIRILTCLCSSLPQTGSEVSADHHTIYLGAVTFKYTSHIWYAQHRINMMRKAYLYLHHFTSGQMSEGMGEVNMRSQVHSFQQLLYFSLQVLIVNICVESSDPFYYQFTNLLTYFIIIRESELSQICHKFATKMSTNYGEIVQPSVI